MRVRATQIGFDNDALKRRYPGEVFDIEDSAFSAKWMECLDQAVKPAPKPAKGKVKGKNANERAQAGEAVGLSELQPDATLPVPQDVTDGDVI